MSEARGRAVRIAETLGAVGLVLTRTAVGVIDPWWTFYPWWADWALLLAVLWLLQANAPRGRSMTWSVHLVMGLMALIYLARQGPFLLRAYGLGP